MSEPQQKPGKSKQNYGTPPAFLDAVKRLLHIQEFGIDLAASPENAVCPHYFTEADNALLQCWLPNGWSWCNPPYADIRPWVEKAAWEAQKGASIAMLLPAGVGSNWWFHHVHGRAYVHFLHPRLTFVGERAPYPKDLALLLYAPYLQGGYNCWGWQ